MPDLYALQGIGNSGKSATLIGLYSALKAKYPAATTQHLHSGTTDISIVMNGVKGLVVGIESQGDPNSRLLRSLQHFSQASCDVIFCACRTSGMTVGWVKSVSPPYTLHFVRQVRAASNFATANSASAAALMQLAGI